MLNFTWQMILITFDYLTSYVHYFHMVFYDFLKFLQIYEVYLSLSAALAE